MDKLPLNTGAYFLERNFKTSRLNSVTLCAVESFAKFNPNVTVHVLVNARNQNLKKSMFL